MNHIPLVTRHLMPLTTNTDDTVVFIAILSGIISAFHFHILHLTLVIKGSPILHYLSLNHLFLIAFIKRNIMLQREGDGDVTIDTVTWFFEEHINGFRDVPDIVLVHHSIHTKVLIIEATSVRTGCHRDCQENEQPYKSVCFHIPTISHPRLYVLVHCPPDTSAKP